MANRTGAKNERFESLSAVKRLSDVRRLSDIKSSKQNADLFPRESEPLAIPEAVAVRYRERARNLPELRVTASLTPDLLAQVEKRTRGTEVTRSSIVRAALHQYFQKESGSADMKTAKGAIIVRSKKQVLFQTNVIIAALEETLAYDPVRHHNLPPPSLRIEDPRYLNELSALVSELRRLNENIEATFTSSSKRPPAPAKTVEKSAIKVKKHVNTFLNKYASTLGTGVGILTVGALGTLLYQLGLPEEVLTQILKKIR